MPSLRYGAKRLFLGCLCVLSLLAIFYEFNHVFRNDINVNASPYSLDFRNKIPLVKMSPPAATTPKRPPTTMSPQEVKKLDTVYQQINKTINESIFPAERIGKYLMLNTEICRDAKTIDFIIIVHTAPGNLVKRQRMRRSFANQTLYYPYQVRIAFLLGKPKDKDLDIALEKEHATHNDTIMADYFDDYHNLTLKGVMGFRWVHEYCPNSKYVLKIDDDVVVDVYQLLTRYTKHMDGKQKSIFCNTWRKNMGILRSGKWKVPKRMFNGLTMFPYYYCSGFTVLLTTDLTGPLYRAARKTPFFWIDDLYLFGILPRIVGGVTYYDYQIGQNISLSPSQTQKCWKKKGLDCPIFSTLVHAGNYWNYWRTIETLHNKTNNITWKATSFYEP